MSAATVVETLDTTKVAGVMRQFDRPDDPGWCGWTIHRSTLDNRHVLITCDVPDDWARTMPGGTTRQGIAQHLALYADALRKAGFGTATWDRDGQSRVLIVAAAQSVADEIAPDIRAHLTKLNPDGGAS